MRELILLCSQAQAEAVSDALLDLGVLSVSVEDADSNTQYEAPIYGEPGLEPEVNAWRNNRVVALLPDELEPVFLIDSLHALFPEQLDLSWQVREVADEDWVRLTQSQFDPIQVGKRIWIVPSWHRNNPDIPEFDSQNPQRLIRIELDPGLAFGTGSHPTTHLCLQWLDENLQPGQTLLDYGCGSGILAIAAKKLGAGRVQAVDIDAQAVIATKDNAKNNWVEVQALLPAELPQGQSDVVVANILSSPLKLMASLLSHRVAPQGQLVLSGILEDQTRELIETYAPWIALTLWQSQDGWVCLHGRKTK